MDPSELTGIWTLQARDIHREADWLFALCNRLVESIHTLLTGQPVSIKRSPRRLGFNVYSFNLAGDLAQTLRFARNEAEMNPDYLDEIEHALIASLNTRALDLLGTDAHEPVPVPDGFDWGPIAERKCVQIVLAARGRQALSAGKPVPSHYAAALTGWTPQALGRFRDGEVKMTSERVGKVTHFDAAALDHIVSAIEDAFFGKDYKPL